MIRVLIAWLTAPVRAYRLGLEVVRLRDVLRQIEIELARPDSERKWHGQEWCIRQRVRDGLDPDEETLPRELRGVNRLTGAAEAPHE